MARTEIEELLEQAKAVLKKWRPPKPETKLSRRTWQEVLDDKPNPPLRAAKL